MKKFLRIAAASMLSCLVLATAAAAYTPVGNVSVPKATPTIDGTIKDGEYPESGHIVLNAENMSAQGWLGEVTASVDLYDAWDKDNFYLAGKVHDSRSATPTTLRATTATRSRFPSTSTTSSSPLNTTAPSSTPGASRLTAPSP